MKDYGRIITKMTQASWLMTPESLSLLLKIADERIVSGRLSDEEIDARLTNNLRGRGRDYDEGDGLNVVEGVGILPLTGPIFGKANLMTRMSGATSLEQFRQDFATLVNDDSVHSIVLDIDSPGGTSDLVQETGEQILASRDVKPVYAIANTMTGSAALWLGSQATKLYSTPSGSVGSLGVYTVHQDQSGEDTQRGHKFTFVSAGPFKVEGNPHEALSEGAIEHRQETVNELYDTFKGAVANGRGLSVEHVEEYFGGGRMLTPKNALAAGMIDAVMPLESLIAGLVANRPRRVQVIAPAANGGSNAPIAATLVGSNLYFGNPPNLEVVEWEHSEPGTGSPPEPRRDEDDRSGDKDGRGIRRDTPPIVHENDVETNNTSSEHGEEVTNMKWSKTVLDALGLSADATDEQVEQAILAAAATAGASDPQAAVAANFAEQYPEQHAELMEARASRLSVNATAFANEYKYFTKGVGEEKASVNKGLSALALDRVKTTHVLIAEGNTAEALEAFGQLMGTVTGEGGIVVYGDAGSTRPVSDDTPTGEATPADKNKTAKWKFNEAVKATQREAGGDSKMSWGDAVAATTKNQPELALAYQNEMANNRSENTQ